MFYPESHHHIQQDHWVDAPAPQSFQLFGYEPFPLVCTKGDGDAPWSNIAYRCHGLLIRGVAKFGHALSKVRFGL